MGSISSRGVKNGTQGGSQGESRGESRRLKRWERARVLMDALESRVLLSALAQQGGYHNDTYSTGNNLNEYVLTPANVSSANFGLSWRVQLDGQVYAQTLAVNNV